MRLLTLSSRSTLVIAVTAIGMQSAIIPPVHAQVAAPRSTAIVAATDPVDAAVTEASERFGVPEHWIRAVMRQESNGDVHAVSSAGAMGLMQVMPGTYAELRIRYGLGADPFTIRDNVLAGTAYLREMHDRYGGLGMLAAYNAGPGRWEDFRAGIRPLPRETIGYLARLGPVLDVGSLPAISSTTEPARPSPFAAPIFVAISDTSSAVETPANDQTTRAVLAANATADTPSNGLFVQRQSAEPTNPAASSSTPPPTVAPAAEPSPPKASTSAEPSVNGLFPPRSGGNRR